MKPILIHVSLFILMLVNTNLLFSQDSYEDSDEGFFMQFNLGFGEETYNNKTKAAAFSFEVGGGASRFGGFLEVSINQCPTLDINTKNYIDLKDCQIWDFKILVHYYPFKIRKIFNPFIAAGPGYSYLERVGDTYVTYNNPLYNQTAREKIGKYFITQVGAGLSIVAFKHLSLIVEYSGSFFRNPDYLNGQQFIVKLGLHNWME